MSSISSNSMQATQKKILTQSPKQRKLMLLILGLLRNLDISDLAYIGLLFFQFLQVLSIIIHGKFQQQWDNTYFYYIKQIISYTTLLPLIKQYPIIHIGLLITSISILIIIGISMLIIARKCSQILVNTSQIEKILISVVSFCVIFAKTILQIPLLFIMLFGIFQTNVNNLIIGLSIILILLYIPYLIYLLLMFTDLNPFNNFICSGQTHYSRIGNLLIKIYLVLFTIIDNNNQLQLVMLIILCCIKLINIWLAHYYRGQQEYNYKIKMYKLCENYVVVIIIGFIIVAHYMSMEAKLIILMIILIITVVPFIFLIQQQNGQKILHQNFILLQQTHKIQTHILKLIQLIDTAHERSSRILLAGYIIFHTRNCNLPDSTCICKQITDSNIQDLDERKKLYFEFLVNLLKGSLNRTASPRRIYILLSFIFQYRLNNRYQAVHSLIKSRTSQNSVMQRLQYLKQMKLVQSQMAQYQSKRNSNLAVDMMRFLKFNLRIVQFQKILDQCTNNYIQFWHEVLQMNLNIKRLQHCGAIIANKKQIVKQYFYNMQQYNSNNAHIMILYDQFLSLVCNQDFQNAKLLQKGETILKNVKQSSKINGKNQKYSENSKTIIIIISGNQKQLGKILQTNNYVKQAIGYNRKQLINQNIQLLMPKIFAQYHTATLQKFLSTSKDRYNGIERLVPVLTKDGYIIPSLAYTKPIPNLEEGIQIVGFLSEYNHIQQDQSYDQKVSYILYQCNTQIIMGISKLCQTQFGIPKCLVYGNPQNTVNQLKIKHIFGVNLQKNQRGMENGKQIIATIDTKALKQQFVIANINSTRKIIQQNAQMRSSIKAEVTISSILQLNYHGFPIRMISIVRDYQASGNYYRKSFLLNQELNRDQKSDSKSQTDDLKDLKDFKNFISIRREPQALRFIGMACIALIIIFSMGTVAYTILHLRKFQIIQATINGIKLAFHNRMYTTELSFEADKLFINRNKVYPTSKIYSQSSSKQKMEQIITEAKQTQIKILPIKYFLNVSQIYINNFNFYPSGQYQTQQKSIDQSITIQLSKYLNIISSNLTYLQPNPLNYRFLTVLNYIQTKYTQIFSLIQSCNTIQYNINNQSKKQNEDIKLLLIIVAVVLVAFSIIWISVSLPKALQVVDINSKVLSLFNLISPYDVEGVIKRCLIFQNNYLVQTNSEKNNARFCPANILNQSKQKQLQIKQNQLKYKSNSSLLKQNIPLNLNSSVAQTSTRGIVPVQLKQKQMNNFDNFDYSQKNNKMINKGNGDKIKAIFTFIGVFLFVIAYAGTVSGYLIIYYNQIESQINIMNTIYNRTAQFQQIKTTYTKYLMNSQLKYNKATISQININMINKIYDTERLLVQDISKNQLQQVINLLNTQNICNYIKNYTQYKIWGDDNLNINQCNNIDNGVLTRGIKTSLVTIMQQIRGMILLSGPQKNMLNMYNVLTQTIRRYQILQKYIVRPLIMVNQQIIQNKTTNKLHINITFYLMNGFFLLTMLIFWRMAWKKYLEYLNQSVWRTKSMLNVIPSKIITNNQILMNQFTSGQLEKIVR